MEIDYPNLSSISIRAIKFWWLLVFASILGALFGLIVNRLLVKPIYSANSTISITINFYEMGHLTQYEQDQFFSHLLTFLRSDPVVTSTINSINQPAFGFEQFRDACFLERQMSVISFRCQAQDSKQASLFSRQWKQQGYKYLLEALGHAQKYVQLSEINEQIETCVQRSALGLNSPYLCEMDHFNKPGIIQELNHEKELSFGIFPGFSLIDGMNAVAPDRPIRNQTNLMVLFGAIVGFLSALILIQTKRL